MRKFSFAIMLAAAATMFFSCQKEQAPKYEANPKADRTVTFSALPMGETKTAFGEPDGNSYPTLWVENDAVKVSVNFATGKDATVTPSADGKKASFSVEYDKAPEAADTYTFYAVSPRAAVVSTSTSFQSWNLDIPSDQTPAAGSPDPAAQLLAANSSAYDAFPPAESVNLQFSHLTAYGCMTITGLGNTSVETVAITAGADIAGRWYYYPTSGEFTANSGSKTITIHTTSAQNIWFALAPVDLAGQSFKVTVNGTISKEGTWPEGKAFQAGRIGKFSIDMSGAQQQEDQVYELVTNVSELTEGSKVIIAGAETEVAMSSTQNPNNRGEASVTKSGNTISNPGDDVEIFTIEAGTVTGTYAFHASKNEGYIYAASGSSNWLRTETALSANSSFAITLDDAGVATVVAQGTNTNNHMRHNAGSSCFSCYKEASSITEKVAIYKLVGSGGDTPGPQPTTPVITVTSDNPIEVAKEGSGKNTIEIEYTLDNADQGEVVNATTDVDWITNLDNEEVGYVYFKVGANTGAERTGTITLSYTGAQSVTVTVTQAAGGTSYDFTTVAELNALATSTATAKFGKLTNAVVSFVPDTKNAVIKDETGSVLLYLDGHGLVQGQTFSGELNVTVKLYNKCAELTACDATFEGNGGEVAPETLTLAQLSGNLSTYQNAYVKVENLTVTAVNNRNVTVTDDGTNTYVVYASANGACAVGDVITVVGTIANYSNKDQIKAWTADAITVSGTADVPQLTVTPTSANWEAGNNETKEFTVTAENGTWEITDNGMLTTNFKL